MTMADMYDKEKCAHLNTSSRSSGQTDCVDCGETWWPIDDKKSDTTEYVNHPDHYGGEDNPYEAIKVIEAWELDFCLGNTVKYISRAGKKGDQVEDLQKAKWYLERRIWQLQGFEESETDKWKRLFRGVETTSSSSMTEEEMEALANRLDQQAAKSESNCTLSDVLRSKSGWHCKKCLKEIDAFDRILETNAVHLCSHTDQMKTYVDNEWCCSTCGRITKRQLTDG